MARNRLAVRLVQLIVVLNRATVRPTARQLARQFGVSERTVKRDIAALAEAHYPMPPTIDQTSEAA